MAANLLNVGARALLANQAALQTAGHNIANVNTAGYSRQSVVMTNVAGQFSGAGYVGKGVDVSTVKRNYSDFLTLQSAVASSVQSADSTRAERLKQLENVFQGGSSGLGAAVNEMLNAFSDVASAPTDLTARTVVLTRANEAAARFRSSSAQLDDLQSGVTTQLTQAVDSINSLATRIAAMNEQISREHGNGQTPNDLLDQRDQLVRDLNQFVQTSTIAASDGSVGIFLANSQALVLGSSANRVALGSSDFPGDGARAALSIVQAGASVALTESNLGGGSVKGLLSFMNGDLVEGRNLLGRMALAVADSVNAQHQLGLDLNGNVGSNLFVPASLTNGIPANTNTGTATLALSVNNASAFVPTDYELRFTSASTGSITRLSDGQVSAFNTAAPPVQVDGLTVGVSAGAVAGDRFLLTPFASPAAHMGTGFSSPRELAVANRVEVRAGSTNGGGLTVSQLAAQSANVNLTANVTLTFNAGSGTFDVVGVGTGNPVGVAYTPGQAINYNGWTLTLAGTPKTGDTITVQAATVAYSATNAGNASALLGLRDRPLFDGAPLSDGYAALMAQLGIRAQSAQYSAEISATIANNLDADRASVSGVNLDEEAAKLLQFQQAYQASAKMMSIAQNLFDALMQGLTR